MQLDLNSELIATVVDQVVCSFDIYQQLDPVGSTVRYEVMKLCNTKVRKGQQWLILGGAGSV